MGLIAHEALVCDIGANISNHSIYFGGILGAQILKSCEPKSHIYHTLQHNLKLYALPTDNAFNVMLDDKIGSTEIALYTEITGRRS